MAFDAWFLTAVLEEVRTKALGSRVEKIFQPSRDTVLLQLRCAEGREKLLLSPSPASPRLHFTACSPENPAEPPMFCMLLRKHLSGARLTAVEQPEMERLAVFTFDTTDDLGSPVQKKLVAELMGKTCNLYLLLPDGRIGDCLRRIGLESARPALPGLYYQYPEPMNRKNPRTLSGAGYQALLEEPGADSLAGRLMDTLGGLSPLVCREAALFAAGDVDARVSGLSPAETGEKLEAFFREALSHPAPYYTRREDGSVGQFAFCPIREYGGDCCQAEGFGALLDACYGRRVQDDALRQKSQALRKTVGSLCQRLTRKLAVQEQELARTYDRERLRQLGDIVTANLHRISRGQTSLQAEDFYDEEMKTITIPLSPALSPQQNAAKFYKDYARMKHAQQELTHQIAQGQEELAYLRSVQEELERSGSDGELEEIRQELCDGGYLRPETGRKRMKQPKSQPERYESTDGFPIYVGRNNRQNDELTLRRARKDDLWLHAQKVPGSHVIIACAGAAVPDDTVTQAAQLAAYHSAARQGQNVAVDVTAVRQVKKPNGARPGMVIYETYRTVYVNPKGEIS